MTSPKCQKGNDYLLPTHTCAHTTQLCTTRFTVNQNTGAISLRGTVDREQQDTYYLTLIASDGGGTLANPNRAITLVVITVQDINDNPPVFSVSGYRFTLLEGTTYTNFLTVTVQNLITY